MGVVYTQGYDDSLLGHLQTLQCGDFLSELCKRMGFFKVRGVKSLETWCLHDD